MSIAILDATLSYLRFNCIWPKKDQELNPGKWYYLKFGLLSMSTTVVLIGSILHLIVSLKNNSTTGISEDLVVIIAEIGVYYFQVVFVWYQKEIARIYVDLSDFEKFGKPLNFDKRNKRLIFLSKSYMGFIDLALVNFCISTFFTKKICKKHNEHRVWQDVCGLVVATWMPFNIVDFPWKQIFYLWQCFSLVLSLKGAAVISFAIMETIEHLVVKLQHLKYLLNKAIDTEDDECRQKCFSTCIKYHINIFDIGKRIDTCYTGCLFLHVLLSGALFGCIGYRIRENFAMNAAWLFVGWLLSLYIVCTSGQHLMDEATSIGDAAYNSKWYERDVSFQKNIIFIITRSQKPLVVHAGPFSYVSHVIILTVIVELPVGANILSYVLQILKTAYSYMTLLNATTT